MSLLRGVTPSYRFRGSVQVYSILVANMLWGVGWAFSPLIILKASELEASEALIGFIVSVSVLSSAVSSLAGGFLSFRGPATFRLVIFSSYLVSSIGFLVAGVGGSWVYVLAGYMIFSINTMGWAPLAHAVAEARRASVEFWMIILLSTSVRLGAIIGGFIGYLVSVTTSSGLLWASLFYALSALPALLIEPPPRREGGYGVRLPRTRLLLLAAVFGLISASPLIFVPLAPLYLERDYGIEVTEIPLAYASYHAAALILPPLIARMLQRLALQATAALVATGIALFLTQNTIAAIAGLTLVGLTGTLDELAYSTFARRFGSQPQYAGVLSFTRSIAKTPLTAIGGILLEFFGETIHVLIAITLIIINIIIFSLFIINKVNINN